MSTRVAHVPRARPARPPSRLRQGFGKSAGLRGRRIDRLVGLLLLLKGLPAAHGLGDPIAARIPRREPRPAATEEMHAWRRFISTTSSHAGCDYGPPSRVLPASRWVSGGTRIVFVGEHGNVKTSRAGWFNRSARRGSRCARSPGRTPRPGDRSHRRRPVTDGFGSAWVRSPVPQLGRMQRARVVASARRRLLLAQHPRRSGGPYIALDNCDGVPPVPRLLCRARLSAGADRDASVGARRAPVSGARGATSVWHHGLRGAIALSGHAARLLERVVVHPLGVSHGLSLASCAGRLLRSSRFGVCAWGSLVRLRGPLRAAVVPHVWVLGRGYSAWAARLYGSASRLEPRAALTRAARSR